MSKVSPQKFGKLRPTRTGRVFAFLTLAILIGCINYDLSLGYAFAFLLAGVWLTAAALASKNLRATSAKLQAPSGVTAGEDANYQLLLSRTERGAPFRVEASAAGGAAAHLFAAEHEAFDLKLPTSRRGEHVPNVVLTVFDPLGLWQSSRPLEAKEALFIWSESEQNPPPPLGEGSAEREDGPKRTAGNAEFAGLRPYVTGDTPCMIAWRQSAARGKMLSRETDSPAAISAELNWSQTSGGTEERASRMAAWVRQLSKAGVPFSLTLDNKRLSLGSGPAHEREALDLLAALPKANGEKLPHKLATAWQEQLPAAAWKFTLLAALWVMLPSVERLPFWGILLGAGLMIWRLLAIERPEILPEKRDTVLGMLAIVAFAALFAGFQSSQALVVGTNILTLLFALKMAESRNVRDGVMVVMVGLFVSLSHFLHSMAPLQALHTLLSAVLMLGALHLWTLPASRKDAPAAGANPQSAARVGLTVAGLSLPLMLMLFVFFPRPAGPLWGFRGGTGATTGLSNSVQAGDIASLAQSHEIAFRATFKGDERPTQDQLYWRGPVMEAYDGISWQVVRGDAPQPNIRPSGATWSYSVLQEPSGLPWVMALESVREVPSNASINNFMSLISRPMTRTTRYNVVSGEGKMGLNESEGRKAYNLNLPKNENPKTRALVEQWKSLPPAQRVQAGLNFFAERGFSYTLEPPLLNKSDRVDDFLFHSKAGFCEHYANAFGVMMREAGVPTRLVTGYQGGEWLGDSLVVRQSNAHAWNEVWLEGEGWVRVDPTAVVAPARVRADLQTALSNPNATEGRAVSGFWASLSGLYNNAQMQWYDSVVNFDQSTQDGALSRLGLGRSGGAGNLLAMLAGGLLALVPIWWFWNRRNETGDQATRMLRRVGRTLGLPPEAAETAGDWAERAGRARPDLAERLQEFARQYNEFRYANHAPEQRHSLLEALRQSARELNGKQR